MIAVRQIPVYALSVFAVLAGLAASVSVVALRTETGNDLLARAASGLLSDETSAVRIEGLRGSLPAHIAVSRIAVSDTNGAWLEVDEADLLWDPWALLYGRIDVTSAHAAGIRLHREPAAGGSENGNGGTLAFVPLSVGSLVVDRVTVDEVVAGVPLIFRIEGALSAHEPDRVASRIRIDRLDGTGGEIDAKAEIHPDGELVLTSRVNEPAGGLIARLAGIPGLPPVRLTLDGKGTIDDWKGRIDAEAGDDIALGADLNIDAGAPIVVAAKGSTKTAGLVGGALRELLSWPIAFETTISWDGGAEKLLVDHLHAEHKAFGVSAEGWLDWAEGRIELHVPVRLPDGAAFSGLMASATFRDAMADIRVEGRLDDPRIVFDGTIGAPTFAPVSVAAIHVAGNIEGADLRSVDLSVGFDGLAGPSAELAGLLGASPILTVSGGFEDDITAFRVNEIAVDGRNVTASLSGMTGLDGTFDLAGRVAVPSVRPLLSVAEGSLSIDVAASMHKPGDPLDAVIAAAIGQFKPDDPNLGAILGSQISLAGDLRWAIGGSLVLNNVSADAGQLSLSGKASFTPDFRAIDSGYALVVSDLAPLSDVLGTALTGAATAKGTVSGPIEDPAVVLNVRAPGLGIDGMALTDTVLEANLKSVVSAARGRLALSAGTPAGPARLSTAVAMTGGTRLSLRDVDGAVGLHTVVFGSLDLSLEDIGIDGELAFKGTDLAAWSRLAGVDLSGRTNARIRLSRQDGGQVAEFDLSGRGGVQDVSFREIELNGTVADLFVSPRVDARMSAAEIRSGDRVLESIETTVKGGLNSAAFDLKLAGGRAFPLAVTATGELRSGDDSTTVKMLSLDGRIAADTPIRLAAPTTLVVGPGIVLDGLDLAIGEGHVGGDVALGLNVAKGSVIVSRLPIGVLDSVLDLGGATGSLDAELRADGPPPNPSITLTGGFSDLQVGDLDLGRAAVVRFEGRYDKGSASAQLDVNGTAGVKMTARVGLPARVSLWPMDVEIADDAPLTGSLDLKGDVRGLAELALGSERRFSGVVTANANLDGTLAAPRIAGHLRLENGEYEDFQLGTVLRNLTLAAESDGESVTLSEARATDGDKGEVTIQGRLGLSADNGYPIDIRLNARDATLIRRDEAKALVSGDVRISEGLMAPRLGGELTVERADIDIAATTAAGATRLPVTEVNADDPKTDISSAAKNENSAAAWAMALDLAIKMPRRIYIHGRGLDSEWSGDVSVTGTSEAPVLMAKLQPIRGEFDLFGRKFVLDKGLVQWDGGDMANPRVNLSAVYTGDGLRVTVRVEGEASNPKISLSSTPALPRDEILARILFGKNKGSLTPLEAVQLADALATLTGKKGGGGGFMSTIRGALGVDRIEIGAGDSSGPSVGVGKYLSEDVYVGVEQGVAADSTKAKVEVQITPNVVIESDVGTNAAGNVGLKWSWDY